MTPNTNCSIVNKWFTNKAEYLEWRSAWKEAYAQLSEDIRDVKRSMRDGDALERSQAQSSLVLRYKPEAQEMIRLRKQSKLDAQAQYQAAKLSKSGVNNLTDLQRA